MTLMTLSPISTVRARARDGDNRKSRHKRHGLQNDVHGAPQILADLRTTLPHGVARAEIFGVPEFHGDGDYSPISRIRNSAAAADGAHPILTGLRANEPHG